MYAVKEIFYSLQGEGAQTGRPTIFLRFSGCNLWNGREADRLSSICKFCDTDFVGTDGSFGGKYATAEALSNEILNLWPKHSSPKCKRYVVCTGGEPLLQLDKSLIEAFHLNGFEIGIETNGTIELPESIDWVCMSPKPASQIKVKQGDELKFVYPQEDLNPKDFEWMDFKHFYIQPMDGSQIQQNIKLAMKYCLENPQWKLSLQSHKILGIR
ncbi:MAG: 7-carboxy-7-deazaguanine synthase [Saprospiraceae bacterium]|nr:7-carboxy-7-deazaguanine synthase [Saprospiraceae bacterium]